MKIYFFIVCLITISAQIVLAQHINDFPGFDRSLLLEAASDTTANVSFGDFNGDGHLDILLVKGRHWPIIDRVLLKLKSDGYEVISYSIKTSFSPSSSGMVSRLSKVSVVI